MLPVAALMLMSFEFTNTETEDLLMPDEYMFGEEGNSPNIDAIKAKALRALNCTTGLNAAQQAGLIPSECPYPATGGMVPVSGVTLNVLSLTSQRERFAPGFSCSQRSFRELEGNGIGYTQTCNAQGYLYEVQFSFYYGLEI
ncbi:MAG: hypothetical protein DI585_04830 [Pseudomonas fluorescens]|nr:MAG: hypothetical protein DI585_04830 [Pseudomonas fluorescens]